MRQRRGRHGVSRRRVGSTGARQASASAIDELIDSETSDGRDDGAGHVATTTTKRSFTSLFDQCLLTQRFVRSALGRGEHHLPFPGELRASGARSRSLSGSAHSAGERHAGPQLGVPSQFLVWVMRVMLVPSVFMVNTSGKPGLPGLVVAPLLVAKTIFLPSGE